MKELEIISKVEKINNVDEKIYNFYADLRNISSLLPPDVNDFNATQDTCSFVIKGQTLNLMIIDRQVPKLIKITTQDASSYNLFLWLQFKQISAYETAVRIVLRVNLNMILRNTMKKTLQQGLDQIVDYMKLIPY